MEIKIGPYEKEDDPAVSRFNQRMQQGGEHYAFSEQFISRMFQRTEHCNLHQELFLAKDEQGEVRGGYYFKYQDFTINGQDTTIADIQLPLSEGIIDKTYNAIGVQLIQDALQRQRYIFGLGMGGFQYPLPKMFKRIGWFLYLVPFYFYIVHAGAFLRDFEVVRKMKKSSRSKNVLIGLVSAFKILHILVFFIRLHSFLYTLFRIGKKVKSESFVEFADFADTLWEENKTHYSIVAKRDQHVLNTLYPASNDKFHRLKVLKNGTCVGWVVMLCTQMEQDKYFGNLKLGTIVDTFCSPQNFKIIVTESVKYLKRLNVDLIICNHSNVICGKHFRRFGFLKGPSNYIFAISRGFKGFFKDHVDFENSLIMRGDGDGPINL